MATLFWVAFSLLAYIYVGYPLLIAVLARLIGREPQAQDITPPVSLLIPAYNEAAHIQAKIENSLALDYPREQLDIVVANDGSTDATAAIAERYRARGIRVISLPRNVGKGQMLNQVVPQLRGEIIAFSDASSELAPEALRLLVRRFADPRVGCACGLYRLLRTGDDVRSEGEGLYWRYETAIKRNEGRLHSILGAHGAFYAIRAALFTPLSAASINDDYLIPMWIVSRGFRAVYEPAARCLEREAATVEGEFARRRRIAAGNCQQIVELWSLLHPRHGWVAFSFFSHKVLRTIAPLLLLAMAITTPFLPSPWALIMGAGQGLLYVSAWAGHICQRQGRTIRWLSPPLYFCLGNLAMLAGLLKFCFSRGPMVWERSR